VTALLTVLALLAGGYLALVLVMFLAQTRLVFPAYLARFGATELSGAARRLRVKTADGTELAGILLSPAGAHRDDEVLLLGFGGNVWNVENMALNLSRQFPAMHVAGFHYRGYRPSGGQPGGAALLADSLAIFDALRAELPDKRTVAVGFSIGTPVAAYLARHRALAGLILVTPFDSLVEVARDHFRWLPVRTLLRHRMPTLDFVRDLPTPTALIAAERDSVVPARRTEPLRRAVPNLVFDRVVAGAEHNDLYDRGEFWSALGEAMTAVLRSRGELAARAAAARTEPG
jgi:pimeloyl-ACP methyl ester carboxylesterase